MFPSGLRPPHLRLIPAGGECPRGERKAQSNERANKQTIKLNKLFSTNPRQRQTFVCVFDQVTRCLERHYFVYFPHFALRLRLAQVPGQRPEKRASAWPGGKPRARPLAWSAYKAAVAELLDACLEQVSSSHQLSARVAVNGVLWGRNSIERSFCLYGAVFRLVSMKLLFFGSVPIWARGASDSASWLKYLTKRGRGIILYHYENPFYGLISTS